jgi:RNA polymerase sigma-70 factor (ECF subfamily)
MNTLEAIAEGQGIFFRSRNLRPASRDTKTWMPTVYSEAPPAHSLTDEADFVRSLADYHDGAWQHLFDTEFQRIYKFAFVRIGEHAAAEDIAAEVFEEASRRIGSYQHRGVPVRAWLYRIARNLTADHLTRRRRRGDIRLDEMPARPEYGLADLESLVDVSAAVARLTPDQQEVIALRFLIGCDLAQTASALSKSVGAVKLLQHRALTALRRHLGGVEGRR